MSHKSLTALISHLGENHDQVVKEWRDSFLSNLQLQSESNPLYDIENIASDFDETSSDTSLSEEGSADENGSNHYFSSDTCTYSSDDDDGDESISDNFDQSSSVTSITCPPQGNSTPETATQIKHKGFLMIGDNVDKNIRR